MSACGAMLAFSKLVMSAPSDASTGLRVHRACAPLLKLAVRCDNTEQLGKRMKHQFNIHGLSGSQLIPLTHLLFSLQVLTHFSLSEVDLCCSPHRRRHELSSNTHALQVRVGEGREAWFCPPAQKQRSETEATQNIISTAAIAAVEACSSNPRHCPNRRVSPCARALAQTTSLWNSCKRDLLFNVNCLARMLRRGRRRWRAA